MARKTKFYAFPQQNSGGFFIRNQNVDEVVVIEAVSEKQAVRKATKLGLFRLSYCECCGPRFYGDFEVFDTRDEVLAEYRVYDTSGPIGTWRFTEDTVIHRYDGTVEHYVGDK